MKPFKKVLGIVALSTALVAGLGVAANAKTIPSYNTIIDKDGYDDDDFKRGWYPEVQDKITIFLYKDSAAKDNAKHWKLYKATSVIPIRHMAWDAAVKDIKTDTKQVTVTANKVGQYYLNIACSKYIKPGKEVEVKWRIKQHGYWFDMKTKLLFKKAAVPYTRFQLTARSTQNQFDLLNDQWGADGTHKAWQHLRGVETLDFWEIYDKKDYSERDLICFVDIRLGGGYNLDKIVVTKKDGHAYTIRRGDSVNLNKIKKLQVKYKVTKNFMTNASYGTFNRPVYQNGWLPKESNGYAHLFDVVLVQTIKF